MPVDLWAIGCIMGELIDGQPLFPGESEIDQLYCIQKVMGPLIPEHKEAFLKNPHFLGLRFPEIAKYETLEKRYMGKISKTGLHFMKSLLCMNPEERLTASQALDHSYFDCFRDESVRPQTSSGLSKLGTSYQNRPSLYSVVNNKKPAPVISNVVCPSKIESEQRSKTRSSMFVSEINEMDNLNKAKELPKQYPEENKPKFPMFHITEETDAKSRIKSLKKKIKIYDTGKYQNKVIKTKTNDGPDVETASGHASTKQLPLIHHHYNFEVSQKKIELKNKMKDDPDLCGGPEEKYFVKATKGPKNKF